MTKETEKGGRRKLASPAMTGEGQDPQEVREDHRAWALRWDGAALSAARGKGEESGQGRGVTGWD